MCLRQSLRVRHAQLLTNEAAAALKVVAPSACAYYADYWNITDFVVVIMELFVYIVGSGSASGVNVPRTLRILRSCGL